MSAANPSRWVGVGLLDLPLYGALTFWSSLEGQPDPNTSSRPGLVSSPPTNTCGATCWAASSA